MQIGKPNIWFILRHKLGLLTNVLLFFGLSIALMVVGTLNSFMVLTVAGVLTFIWMAFWCMENWHRLWWRNND